MKKLILIALFASNVANAVCQNGHYIEHDGKVTIDYGISSKCTDVALSEMDAIAELTKPNPEELEKMQKDNRKESDAEKLFNSILELF